MPRLSEHQGQRYLIAGVIALIAVIACAGNTASAHSPVAPMRSQVAQTTAQDTSAMIPPGFGTLRQEDLSISLTVNGLTVRAMPMDEEFIRTLAPDSYRNIHNLRESKRARLDTIAHRTGYSSLSVWQFQFFNVQQGEAPFSPRDVVITNQGRDYKPLETIGLSTGFAEQRVRQGQTQTGILVFDGTLSANQPLTLTVGSQSNSSWESVLKRVENERARVRSRAGTAGSGGRGGVR